MPRLKLGKNAYSCTILETKLQDIPIFNGMSYFEITHLMECQNIVYSIKRTGK